MRLWQLGNHPTPCRCDLCETIRVILDAILGRRRTCGPPLPPARRIEEIGIQSRCDRACSPVALALGQGVTQLQGQKSPRSRHPVGSWCRRLLYSARIKSWISVACPGISLSEVLKFVTRASSIGFRLASLAPT